MSGFIPGRQYRVTHLTTADHDGSIDCEFGRLFADDLGDGVWAELVPVPLPETPDSLVLLTRDNPHDPSRRQRLPFRYESDSHWHAMGGGRWTTADLQAAVAGHLKGEITVLFDAGAQS